MEIHNEIEVARAISKHLKDNHISPTDVLHIEFSGTSWQVKCHISLIPKELSYLQYSFDLTPET